jgi:hypothetical protein
MKILKKFWGVALVVILLSTMLLSATPVSAGTLSYSVATSPRDAIGGIIPTAGPLFGAVVNALAVSEDGNTIYAATSVGGAKSVNAGRTWTALTTGLAATDMVAMAPDKTNFVVFADATAFTVAVSQNGGSLFSALGAVRDTANINAATAINGIDVSPTVSGINYIAVAGTDAGGQSELYFFNMGAPIANWAGARTDFPPSTAITPPGASAVNNLMAVAFSPNFASDYVALVVEEDVTGTRTLLHEYSFNSFDYNDSTYAAYPVVLDAVTVGPMVKANIVIAPAYYGGDESTRTVFVSIDGAAADDAVYRVNDIAPAALAWAGPAPSVYSIAYNGTTLVAGAAATNIVYTNAAPLSPTNIFLPNRAVKRSGGNMAGITNVSVAWSGTNVISANQAATNSAFSVSTDNGLTFNDISLVSMVGFNINDFVVPADGVNRYVIADDGAVTSIFYFDGTYWMRTRTVAALGPYVAAASPTNFSILYIVDTASRAIFYTNNAGVSNWLPRTVPNVPAGAFPVDIAVESDSVIYVATSTGAAGAVIRSATSGFTWGPALTPTAMVDVASITLVGVNNLLAGGTAGEVAYTTDGGLTWIPTAPVVAAPGNSIYLAADGLTTGSNIYSVDSANIFIRRWTIGVSTNWGVFPIGANPALYLSTGIALVDGTLYVVGTTGADSVLTRSLNPAAIVPAFASTTAIAAQVFPPVGASVLNVVPDVIKVSAGNTLWFTDVAAPDRILTYTDSLAPLSAAPVLQNPIDGAIVQVNNLTGIAYNITLIWANASFATSYRVEIALDSAFTNPVTPAGGVPVVANPALLSQLVSVGPTGTIVVNFQPGQQYFWRVRADLPFFSAYSATFSFTIMPGQALVADLSAPANGGTVPSTNPSFSWTPLGGVTSYDFQLDTSTTFTAPLYAATAYGGGLDLPASINLERGRTYFWRVRALTPIQGEWSTIGNFTVATLETTSTVTTVTPTTTTVTTTQITIPPATSTVITFPAGTSTVNEVNPTYIWAIIIIGAVLVLAVIVLIVRTRRSV